MVLTYKQFRRFLLGAVKYADEIMFRNDSVGNAGLYFDKDKYEGQYYVQYKGTVITSSISGSPSWTAKSGYSVYDFGLGTELKFTYNYYSRKAGAINFTNVPKLITSGTYNPTERNDTVSWRYAYVPTSYGSKWLAWAKSFIANPNASRPYWTGFQDFNPVYLESLYKSRKFYVPKSATV